MNYDVLIDGSMIEVDVKDGKVTLKGEVDSKYEALMAVEDAFKAGAKSVKI